MPCVATIRHVAGLVVSPLLKERWVACLGADTPDLYVKSHTVDKLLLIDKHRCVQELTIKVARADN